MVRLLNTATYNVVFAAGRIKAVTSAAVCEAALQVALCVLLGMVWDLEGLGLASALASLASLVILVHSLAQVLNMQISDLRLLKNTLGYVSVAALPALAGSAIITYRPLQGWWELAGFATIYSILAAGFLLLCDATLRGMAVRCLRLSRT